MPPYGDEGVVQNATASRVREATHVSATGPLSGRTGNGTVGGSISYNQAKSG